MQDRPDVTRVAAQARLRELVASTRVGDRLPGERTLSASIGAARMTIRRATDTLVAEGLVQRRHGSGTYVAPKPFARLLGLTSFTDDMRERGLSATSRIVSFEEISAAPEIAESLGVHTGDPVIRFTRVRLANDEPMALETVSIPALLVPGLGRADLTGSLYQVLLERYGLVTGSASMTIEPVMPDESSRDLLATDSRQACLRLRMVDRDPRGRILMIADCLYRGDRYQLSAEISGAAFPQAHQRSQG